MDKKKNTRGYREYFVRGEHLKLKELKRRARKLDKKRKRYLFKDNIPPYPRPEFHVSHLQHDTDRGSLCWIHKDGGFKDPHGGFKDPHGDFGDPPLVWWSLAVGPAEVRSAEMRLLKQTFQSRTEEKVHMQQNFLEKFATSPAFSKESRYGSYRFTFALEEVLKAYKEQFCSGAPPVLRVFKTVLYKQEVVYAVLVHSPDNNELFSDYPELPDDDLSAVCAYRRDQNIFIWRPEAMCGTHRYELGKDPEKNWMHTSGLIENPEYYVWDHVALALHVENGQVLKFGSDRLGQNLKFCKPSKVTITSKFYFDNFKEAQSVIKSLWPDSSLEKDFAALSL